MLQVMNTGMYLSYSHVCHRWWLQVFICYIYTYVTGGDYRYVFVIFTRMSQVVITGIYLLYSQDWVRATQYWLLLLCITFVVDKTQIPMSLVFSSTNARIQIYRTRRGHAYHCITYVLFYMKYNLVLYFETTIKIWNTFA
jgi:hypothetical protein